ncbi:hypothetical protein BC829DRAFT_440633 [Chytridium lagenaria]|nr:hypothetical protein BC829DRAFT_440633 [Chytridium lagenaria]
MIDDVLRVCAEEVALEGKAGCSISRLWKLLDDRWIDITSSKSPLDCARVENVAEGTSVIPLDDVDDIWGVDWDVETCMDQLLLTDGGMGDDIDPFAGALENPSREQAKGEERKASSDDEDEDEDEGSEDEDDVATKPELAQELRSTSYTSIIEKYGETLKVTAFDEQIRRCLLGTSETHLRLTGQLHDVLLAVARGRAEGTTQANIGKHLNLDPRKERVMKGDDHEDLLKQIHSMLDKPAGYEFSYQTNSGETKTRVKYNSEVLMQRITTMLSGAKNKTMLVQDIMDALLCADPTRVERRIFNARLSTLANAGYLEKVSALVTTELGEERRQRCVRLLKMFTPHAADSGHAPGDESRLKTYQEKRLEDPERSEIIGEGGIFADMPLDYQIFRLIDLAGTRGVIGKVIERSLGNVGRIIEKIMKRLQKPISKTEPAPIRSECEFQGRERRFRYFTKENFLRMKDEKRIEENLPILQIPDEPSTSTQPKKLVTPTEVEKVKATAKSRPVKSKHLAKRSRPDDGTDESSIDEEMESEGLLKTVKASVKLLSGKAITKVVVFHADLQHDDPMVKEFIDGLQDSVLFPSYKGKPTRAPVDPNLKVQRIQDLLDLEDAEEPSDVSMDTNESYTHPFEIATDGTITPPSYDFGSQSNQSSPSQAVLSLQSQSSQSRVIAPDSVLSILAKRVTRSTPKKISGRILLASERGGLCNQPRVESAESVSRFAGIRNGQFVFGIFNIFHDMPLDLFLKVIGQSKSNDELSAFIQTESNLQTTLQNLPPSLKAIIAQRRIKEVVFPMLNALELLSLVKPEAAAAPDSGVLSDLASLEIPASQSNRYVLNRVAPCYDYRRPNMPLLRNYLFDSEEVVKEYWIELEHISTHDSRLDQKDGKSKEIVNQASQLSQFIPYMKHLRNWHFVYPLTRQERDVLEKYIDRERGSTPIGNEALLNQVIAESGVTMSKAKFFYARVEQNFKYKIMKMHERRQRISAMAEQRAALLAAQREEILARERAEGRVVDENEDIQIRQRFQPLDKEKRLRIQKRVQDTLDKRKRRRQQGGQDDDGEVLETSFTNQYETASIRTRWVWTKEEEDAMLYGYAALEWLYALRTGRGKISWTPMASVIDKPRDVIRRRVDLLLRNPYHAAKVDELRKEWHLALAKGYEEGKIVNFSRATKVAAEEELPSVIKYFIAWSKENSSTVHEETASASTLYFPSNTEELESLYDVLPSLQKTKSRDLDFWIHDIPTTRARMSILLSQALFSQIGDNLFPVIPHNAVPSVDRIRVLAFIATSKSVLLTPEPVYDKRYAQMALNSFPDLVIGGGGRIVGKKVARRRNMCAVIDMALRNLVTLKPVEDGRRLRKGEKMETAEDRVGKRREVGGESVGMDIDLGVNLEVQGLSEHAAVMEEIMKAAGWQGLALEELRDHPGLGHIDDATLRSTLKSLISPTKLPILSLSWSC